jgi:hypothetical protein
VKVHLVSHASVVIEAEDVSLWTDPWLFGKAFNDSWSLFPQPVWDSNWLSRIAFLWISHEHPDHFHIPTLKSLPDDFKRRVTVLFQENNSEKMFRAFKGLGFTKQLKLPHRKLVALSPQTRVYCYQEGLMNSALLVESAGRRVFNVNDAELRTGDCRLVRRDVGPCDAVLNQFSIAGYSGLPDAEGRLSRMAKQILDNMVANHRDLGARTTVPFASFIYFSCTDNAYINKYANTPRRVYDRFVNEGLDATVLYPGESFDVASRHDSSAALEKFEVDYRRLATLPLDAPKLITVESLRDAFVKLALQLEERFPRAVLGLLRPVSVRIPDLGVTVRMSVPKKSWQLIERTEPEADLVMNSQPLSFAFSYPFGVQTLGVSARYRLQHSIRNWQLHRAIFALNNAEVYLGQRGILSIDNARFVTRRLRGSARQFARRVSTMLG